MIVKNPTVDELLLNFPNLAEAVSILINGLKENKNPKYVLYLWDEARQDDWKVQTKKCLTTKHLF